MVVKSEDNFPTTPIVGRVVFKGAKLYMCVAINNTIPVWLPLTNKIDTYVHTEAVAATTWTVTHNLNTTIPLLQIYNAAGEMLIPDSVTPTSNNIMEVTFNTAVDGTAVVLFGDLIPQSGIGLLEPSPALIVYSYVEAIDNPNAFGTSHIDQFGFSLASDNTYIVIGAVKEDDAGGTDSGKVYIFSATDNTLLHTLDNPTAFGTSQSDLFGTSVAVSSDRVAVGVPSEDEASGLGSGKVYIFNAITGALTITIDNPNIHTVTTNDQFGWDVDIFDDKVIIGAPNEDEAVGGIGSGKTFIYNADTGALIHTLADPNPEGTSDGDNFGTAVAIDGTNAIIGAKGETNAVGLGVGKAYIYDVTLGTLTHTFDDPNDSGTSAADQYGKSVDILGDYALVGARGKDGSSGRAYVYGVTSGALLHTLDNPNAFNTTSGDVFGEYVALTSAQAVVSAILEDDASGTESGKVYTFSLETGLLLQTFDNPNVIGTSANDNFGNAVSSSDDKIYIASFKEDDSSFIDSGKVYVYS